VIYDIERLLKGFLWCQGELTKGKAKVSWNSVCKPKEQGGLGLKNLRTWNEVLLMKHMWNVATKKETLCVKWIYMEKLKGKSIWEIECDSNSSFGWKSLLKLRGIVRKHIWWKIGNGKKVNVWHDTWSSVCPLSEFIGTRDMYDARLKNDCTISSVILNEKEGYAVWVNNLGHEKKFKTGDVWKDMCINDPKVEWYKMVWFPHAIPRHAFVSCCEFTNGIWTEMNKRLNIGLSSVWDNIVQEIIIMPMNNNIWSIIRRLVCAAAVYFVWQERNKRMFGEEKKDSGELIKIGIESVRMKLMGLKVKDSRSVKEVERTCNVKMQRMIKETV
ncbi:hypothetical protein Tco_1412490, partial [Tanacetum coccineum]